MLKIREYGASLVALCLFTGQVHAAQTAPPTAPGVGAGPDTALQEIVVTAQKRVENIQNVPLSIQAVSGDDLKAAGVNDASQLGKLVPSLVISNADIFGAGISVRIRGFGTPGDGATDSDVAAYIDGAFIPRPGTILSSFLDIKNVEVLNGPQGTLFGRNAAMGAISINTNAPTHEQSLDASVEGGSYGTYAGTVVANTPVSNNVAIRLALKDSHTDGFYHNDLDGRTYGRNNSFVGRASVLVDVTPDITWTLRVDGAKTTGDGAYPQAVDTGTATPAQLAGLTGFLGIFGAPPPVYSATPSYNFNQLFTNPSLSDKQYGITSDIGWSVAPQLTLRLIDGYRDWRNNQLVGDTLSTSLDLLNVRQKFKSLSQSHELQLVSTRDAYLDGKLGFTAGLYYFHEDYSIDTFTNLGSQFCSILVGGLAPALVPACFAAPQTNAGLGFFNQSTNSYAAYGQVNYNILPTLSLDLGVRQTWDKKDATLTNTAPNPIALFPLEVNEGPYNFHLPENKPSFRASLSWQATPEIMPFATFSTGYKSGGVNSATSGFAPLAPQFRVFGPETVQDYEIGVKSVLLNGKAQVNVSLFNTDLDNFQDRSFSGTQFLTRNSGNVRSRGVDFDSRFRPVSNLTLNLSATYLNAKYLTDTNAPGLEGCAGAPGCPLVQDLSGKPLQFSPKLQGNAGFDWKIGEFLGGYHVALAGNEHYSSSFLTSNTDNPGSRLPGYGTTDLSIGFSTPDERWKLEVFGTNILDKHYYVATIPQVLGSIMGVNNTTTGATLYRGFLGEPLRVGARVSARF